MLTKNFYNYMFTKVVKEDIKGALVAYDGTTHDAYFPSSNSYDLILNYLYKLNTSPTNSAGVVIGTGVTPATPDDYKLESLITSGFSTNNQSAATVSKDATGVSVSASYWITNTGTTPLVISEIGAVGTVHSRSDANVHDCALLDRTVLETPITINPGESKQVTYTIRFNYPTA